MSLTDADVKEQVEVKNDWEKYFKGWYGVHYGIGISTIVLSTFNAVKPFELSTPFQTEVMYKTSGWLLALFTGVFTFLAASDRGNRYQRAWALLNIALTRYRNKRADLDEVLDAYSAGEDIIHQSHGNRPPRVTRKGKAS